MTAQEYLEKYLEEYKKAGERADLYLKEYNAEKQRLGEIRSGVGDGTPRSGKISKPTEAQALRLAAKAEKWKKAALDELELRNEIAELIHSVPNPYRAILYERYIEGKEWEDVGAAVGYTGRHCQNLHKEALEILEKHFIPFHSEP